MPWTIRPTTCAWSSAGWPFEEGCDLGVYKVGCAYLDHPGILIGDDMTTEAFVAKTMWVLGQSRDPQRVSELFRRPINRDCAIG